MSKHLNDHRLLAYLENDLAPGRRAQAETHLNACSACRARLDRLARSAESLSVTLDAVGRQVPLSPDRSWAALVQRRQRQQTGPLGLWLRSPLRRAATLVVLGILVVGLVGLVHTLAITGFAPDEATPVPDATPTVGVSSMPGPLPRLYPGEPPAPVACLILGVDGESAASDEIDSLLLLYLDAGAKRAFLLSIPRDLYVEVPGHGQTRVGSVYRVGERGEATDGLALAKETVAAALGFPVQHAALVRFEGFITLIDAIGGVEVDVPYLIDDPKFPDTKKGYDPLVIPAGRHRFDGAIALRYARTRVAPAPGFDRAFRQRQIILAAYERARQPDVLSRLISQAASLWIAAADSVETDLSLNAVIDLALLAPTLSGGDIATARLDECCTVQYTTDGGELVLLPQSEEIETMMKHLLEGETER